MYLFIGSISNVLKHDRINHMLTEIGSSFLQSTARDLQSLAAKQGLPHGGGGRNRARSG